MGRSLDVQGQYTYTATRNMTTLRMMIVCRDGRSISIRRSSVINRSIRFV